MLCDDLDGGMGGVVGRRSKREGIYVYILLVHFLVHRNYYNVKQLYSN